MDVHTRKRKYGNKNGGAEMSIAFKTVKAITIPEGSVKKITNSAGVVLWQKQKLYSYQKFVAYEWKKYNTKNEYYAASVREGDYFSVDDSEIVEEARGVTADPNTGEISCTSLTRMTFATFKETGYTSGFKYNGEWCWYDSMYTCCYKISVKQQKAKDSYIGEVTATSRSAYPDNNYSGSYWYVYNGINYTTVTSEYKLNEGAQTTLSGMSSQRPSGYPSVWVDTNGTIKGNGSAYTNTWRSYYRTYQSTYPYIYHNSKWYRIVSATSSAATVVPLTTAKG